MSDIYPLVVVLDRYNGTYSGGKWTAWNMDYSDIPKKVSGDDIECSEFFAIHHLIYGRGETPKEAIDDLKCMLQRGSHMPKEHIKAVSGSTEDEEDDEMKATSVQRIENVNDICFSIENHPIERESKLTIVASTNDDVFAFELEGPDLLPNCKKVGLFTGWEKDQKISYLEKENKIMLDTNRKLQEKIFHLEELKTPTIENFADEEPSSRRDILRCAEKCVCGQREQDYGTPESNFQLIADLWNQYLFKEPGAKEIFGIGPMDVSMMMALLKIARIRNGGGSGDSFVDLAGYAACGGEIWADKKSQKDQN